MSDFKVMNDDEIRDFCIKKDLKIYELEKQLQQKDNIIKEAREYINIHLDIDNETGGYHLKHIFDSSNLYKLLKILDKENK